MTGKVEIVNLALARLGESPIQDLNEGSVPANTAGLLYDSSRRAALRDFNWNFALSTARLARFAHAEGTPGDFRFTYALPPDCLRVIRLRSGVPFALRGNRVHTDAEEADLEYIRDVTDEAEFDSKFIEALSYKLASELAMSVKGSGELMASYSNAYANFIRQAASESAGEIRVHLSENPYVESRI